MITFVLVHGSNGGGWVWQKLVPLLQAEGCTVYAPTLTGLGDRSHLLGCEINLTTHITDVANLLYYEDLRDVILVGNSYAGMVITGVAAKVPERLKLLVYLDAYLPDPGQSEADLWPAEIRAAREADAAAHGNTTQAPPPAIFAVTDPLLADWISQRSTPHPFATYTEPVPSGAIQSDTFPRVFIHCTGNPPSTPAIFTPFATKAKGMGWDVIELAEGHLSMLTAPDQLAGILLGFTRRP